MKVGNEKQLFFPYGGAKSFSDLTTIGLPDIDSDLWYSHIKQNNCDVGPFITGLEAFHEIFHAHNINVFSSNIISAPGLRHQLLFATSDNQNIPLTLFDDKSSDLYYSFKKQCYGGASIIFHRHHKVGKTYIRGNQDKPCQSIHRLDGVGLYLSCIATRMPTGFHIRRSEANGFRPEIRDRSLWAINWMDWINKYQNKHISHRYNTGGLENISRVIVSWLQYGTVPIIILLR